MADWNTAQIIVPCINGNVCNGKKTRETKRGEEGVPPDRSHKECKIFRNRTEEESKTQDLQAVEGRNKILQHCSVFSGAPTHSLLMGPVPGDAMAVLSIFQLFLQLPVTGSQPCLAAMSGPLMGTVTSPGSVHQAPGMLPSGWHGHPLGPPAAWLPDAKDQLVLAAPQQGC